MGKALGIVYRTIATNLARKAGYTKSITVVRRDLEKNPG